MLNEQMFSAAGEFILVRPAKVKEKTDGGLIMPDKHVAEQQYKVSRAEVVDVGPRAFVLGGEMVEPRCKPGAIVIFPTYEGALEKNDDGDEFRFIKDDLIMGFVENE